MKFRAPAKINLTLNVCDVRSDGYHALESVFHCVDFFDELSITESENMELSLSKDLGISAEENLVMKAARAFKEAFQLEQNYHLHLVKNIWHGAGLGGGSSDAATVLFGLAHLNGISPKDERVLKIASALGSDVAVFLQGSAANYMVGKGDELKASLSAAAGIPLVLAMHPDSHTPTPAVYHAFDASPQACKDASEMIAALADKDAAQIAAALYNNLEHAAFAVDEKTRELKAFLSAQEKSLGALVSGSGASCFALCRSQEDAQDLATQCQAHGYKAVGSALSAQSIEIVQA